MPLSNKIWCQVLLSIRISKYILPIYYFLITKTTKNNFLYLDIFIITYTQVLKNC